MSPFSRNRSAFTLIELLIVILIIAVLIAIAVPSFLNQQNKAKDSAVQQSLAVTATDLKAEWTSGQNQTQGFLPGTGTSDSAGILNDKTTMLGDLASDEPQYSYITDLSMTAPGVIAVARYDNNQAAVCGQSTSNNKSIFCFVVNEQGQLTNQQYSDVRSPSLFADLTGSTSALAATGTSEEVQFTSSSAVAASCFAGAIEQGASETSATWTGCQGQGTVSFGWSNAVTGTTQAAPTVTANQDPTISGTTTQGQTLTANPGTWSNSPSFSYQWQDCTNSGSTCTNTPGATNSTYTLQSSDVGNTMQVIVTGKNGGGSNSVTSAETVTIAPVFPVSSQSQGPTISGVAKEGQTLTASPGSWTGNPAFSYQWQTCNSSGGSCVNITGATSMTYVLQSSDVDNTVQVIVTGTNASGHASATSSQTATIVAGAAPANSVLPKLSGDAQEGQTITTTSGTWTSSGAKTYTYQWQVCTGSGTGCSNVGSPVTISAMTDTYTLPTGSAGKYYQANVTATSSGGATPATSSNNSGAIAETYNEEILNATATNPTPMDYWKLNGDLTNSAQQNEAGQPSTAGLSGSGNTYVAGPDGSAPNSQAVTVGGSSNPLAMPDTNSASCSATSAANTSGGTANGCVFNSTTVGLWFKTTSGGVLVSEMETRYPTVPSAGWMNALYVGTDGYLHGALYNYTILSSNTVVDNGQWHYAMISIWGNTEMLWLDGVLQNTGTGTWNWTDYNMNNSEIGVGDTADWPDGPAGFYEFTGDIADVTLYGTYADFRSTSSSVVMAQYKAANPANFAIK